MSQNCFELLDNPIFLHFLNRELWETENIQFSDEELCSIVLTALLSTTSYVYIGHALLLEAVLKYPKTAELLIEMEKFGYVCLVGNDFNINNFMSRRQELYRHDKKKYSIYFQDNLKGVPWPKNPVISNMDTTTILSETFVKIANDREVDDDYKIYKFTSHDRNFLGRRMEYQKRSKIAVTKKLFSTAVIPVKAENNIRRLIIQIFNKRYCNEFGGVCITGIPRLTYYDQFQNTSIFYNYTIMWEILKALKAFSGDFSNIKEQLLRFRENKGFKICLLEIRKFLSGIIEMQYPIAYLITFIRTVLKNKFCIGDDCEKIALKLWTISNELSKKYEEFKRGYEKMSNNVKRILIISASVLEYRVLRDCAKKRKYIFSDIDTNLDDCSYAECLAKDGVQVFLVRTDMGSLNAAHTMELLNNSIKPDFVIVGGICVGLRKKEQKISQLLISKQIHDYDIQKIANGKRILRGTTLPANRYLYDKCILECFDMATDEYDDGLILSANILSNDIDLVKQMKEDKPDAIGYEMEGTGISYICNIFHNRWIMIKAISDWGFGKKDSDQQKAALKSYEFIFNVIEKRMNF